MEAIQKHIKARSFVRRAITAYRQGQYEKAAHIYSKAIEFHTDSANVSVSTLVSLLTNRAACRLSIVQYETCIQDCSRALMLAQQASQNETASNNKGAKSAVLQEAVRTALVRRGTAQCWLGRLSEAKQDYEEVAKLQKVAIAACYDSDSEQRARLEQDLDDVRADIDKISRAHQAA